MNQKKNDCIFAEFGLDKEATIQEFKGIHETAGYVNMQYGDIIKMVAAHPTWTLEKKMLFIFLEGRFVEFNSLAQATKDAMAMMNVMMADKEKETDGTTSH